MRVLENMCSVSYGSGLPQPACSRKRPLWYLHRNGNRLVRPNFPLNSVATKQDSWTD